MYTGKTGVTADRDKIEFRLFNSSSIFHITLREELFSYRSKTNHAVLSWFHSASHLSQVPWREVEGHYSPDDELSVTLAQLHNEHSSRASTTINNAFNTLQRPEYLHKMGWIKRLQGVGERRQPVGHQQSDGMDYEDRQTSSSSAKLQTSRFQRPTSARAVPRRSAGCSRRTARRDPQICRN